MKTGSLTDIGLRREINQDYLYVSAEKVGKLPNLFIVADGMGGHVSGEFASRYAVTSFVESVKTGRLSDPRKIMERAAQTANKNIRLYAGAHRDMTGMGTTLVAACISGNHLKVVNIGDSRLYVSGEHLVQITEDHSLVQEMVRIGEMTQGGARKSPDKNIITRALGVTEKAEPDFFDIELKENERVILCTDGLTNMVGPAEMQEILSMHEEPNTRAELLVAKANEHGGVDNITVIIIEPELGEEQL